jgi:prepilin-type N-terminal cleavage/methylation domain-containing protein
MIIAATKPNRAKAFSLIEMVGVLAIISLLAAAAAPTFIKRIDHDFRTSEKLVTRKLAEGLRENCIRNGRVPAVPDWPAAIASNLDLNVSQVLANSRKHTRRFLADPAFSINGSALPYVQGTSGSLSAPVNARGIILSTAAVPLPSLTGISGTDFTNIWVTADGTKPAALSSWGGRAEDLIIERIDLAPIFHKVVLVNVDPLPDDLPNRGYYALSTNAATWHPPESFLTLYVIQDTVLSFYRANGTSVDISEILKNDMSFVYRRSKWGRRLGGSDESIGDFGELVSEFMEGPPPAAPKFAATQQAVINEVYSFLWAYAVWANGDANTVYTASGTAITPAVMPFGSAPNFPNFLRADEARTHMVDFTNSLIH